MATITTFTAREILDSRGTPTIEATCVLESGAVGTVGIPSGASTGKFEAHELRDGDPLRYDGKGVLKAIEHLSGAIAEECRGKEWDQSALDQRLIELDGTENKSRLGANAILGASLSFAIASANEAGKELYMHVGMLAENTTCALPQPFFNVINGGKHSDSGLDIQEFMIAPVGDIPIGEKMRIGAEVIRALRRILIAEGYLVGVGDEGGFAPKLRSNEEALTMLVRAIEEAKQSTATVKIGIDVAASSFWKDGAYVLHEGGGENTHSTDQMILWYEELLSKYPIISIEDGLAEEDWDGFTHMMDRLGNRVQIVGDDLTVTNARKIEMAIERGAINAVLIKPNQIGTLTETIRASMLTKSAGYAPFMSHRSGETNDTYIADLAVGLSCPYIKSGSLVRGERIAKYNRLMHIASSLSS